jgi:hypothetical protein
MKNTWTIISLILLFSCQENLEIDSKTNWEKELIGVGYFGKRIDSLNYLFYYYPMENNQPGKLKEIFKHKIYISGDTVTFPNFLLRNFFSDEKTHAEIREDSSTFLISQVSPHYLFTKIRGHEVIPNTLYYEKYPNKYPEKFSYQFVSGFDYFDSFKVEISGKDSIKVWLKGGAYNPYIYEQYEKNEIDDLFISSYLNLINNKRYDTSSFSLKGAIFCGSSMYETLVYNDSLFEYTTYFRRLPDAGILLNYFRSKVDSELHGLKKHDLDLKSPFEPKRFKELPVAVENIEILAPPNEL